MLVLPAALLAVATFGPNPAGTESERRRPAVAATYRIVDVGVPSTIGPLARPIALNNSGQIVGTVIDEANLATHCVAWTGTRMVDFGNAQSLSCYPSSGITDAGFSFHPSS
jgi:hypothetical protein